MQLFNFAPYLKNTKSAIKMMCASFFDFTRKLKPKYGGIMKMKRIWHTFYIVLDDSLQTVSISSFSTGIVIFDKKGK